MFVLGTAGHVDHGKSTLVTALTGIDPDRLQEEKERGMTIDLGFAWLKLPSEREVSIVDVPGHERFIKNMLAGVGGIDLALLIIAADEGVMPQTREHLAILDLLQVGRGIAVITKKDLVDEDWLELVYADAEEVLKPTVLRGAPTIAVSAVTGEGLPELTAAIDRVLEAMPVRADTGRPRLPIDRIFTISGFGTVVTGTLVDGRLTVGQEVEILPRGLRSRVRGLQTHRHKVEAIGPGNRAAVNVAGLAVTDLQRGDVLTTPGWLRPTTALDVRLRATRDLARPIPHNAPVTFHTGSAEAVGRIRLLDVPQLEPGKSALAQIKLEEAIAAAKGDFFIVRSSNSTLGGGQVIDPAPKRHRRFQPSTLKALDTLEKGSPAELLLQALARDEPADLRSAIDRAGLTSEAGLAAARSMVGDGRLVLLGQGPELQPSVQAMTAAGWAAITGRVRSLAGAYHKQFPLRLGMAREELKSRLKLSPRAFPDVLATLARTGVIVEEGTIVRLPEHRVRLNPAQQRQVDAFLAALRGNPYLPPSEAIPDVELLQALIDGGQVVKLTENVVFLADVYRQMVERVSSHAREQGKITVAEVRDLFNTSRKYALALMEHLDEIKLTRRVGDERVLRE